MSTIINPKTGRTIKVNGPTYRKLVNTGFITEQGKHTKRRVEEIDNLNFKVSFTQAQNALRRKQTWEWNYVFENATTVFIESSLLDGSQLNHVETGRKMRMTKSDFEHFLTTISSFPYWHQQGEGNPTITISSEGKSRKFRSAKAATKFLVDGFVKFGKGQ